MVWLGRDTTMRTIWTPYQKVFMFPFYAKAGTNSVCQGYEVGVNGILYQSMLNLSDEFLQAHPEVFDPGTAKYSHYNLPFCFKPSVRRMLIVGAGTGNNAAAAVRHGVEQIDCVEIDPQIYALGKELHPERPYDSPRVRMIVNDARAFFHQASGPYDVIWFGLLDSYGLGSSYNNLRLDHYVYTMESLQEARKLLARDGLIILNFATSSPMLADRLAGQLKQIFGCEPLAYWAGYFPNYGGWGGVTVISGSRPVTPTNIADRALQDFVQSHRLTLPGTTQPTTDDWPYLYLRRPGIPALHLLTSLAVLGAVGVAGRRAFALRSRLDWHFFALGAAFLLLEV
jgi:spermidine synthase